MIYFLTANRFVLLIGLYRKPRRRDMDKQDSIQKIGRNKLYHYENEWWFFWNRNWNFPHRFFLFYPDAMATFLENWIPTFYNCINCCSQIHLEIDRHSQAGICTFYGPGKKIQSRFIELLGLFLIFPLYALVISIDPDPGTVTDITWMITFFLILTGIIANARFYFIITLIISQLLNPIYRAPYWRSFSMQYLWSCLLRKLFKNGQLLLEKNRNGKVRVFQKPENFIQFVLILLIAAAFQYFLYIFFRPDVTNFIKIGVYKTCLHAWSSFSNLAYLYRICL